MKKYIFLLFMILLATPLINAECNPTNDFILGDEINICSGNCTLQNGSVCGIDVSCNITIGKFNVTNKAMSNISTPIDVVFNYSLGNSSISNFTGCFPVTMSCEGNDGWTDPINFQTCISSVSTFSNYGGGMSTGSSPQLDLSTLRKELKMEFDGFLNGKFKEFLFKFWFWILFLFIFIIIFIAVWRRQRLKSMAKSFAKEVNRKTKK